LSSRRPYFTYIAVIAVIVIVVVGLTYAYVTTSSLQAQLSTESSSFAAIQSQLSSVQSQLLSASAGELQELNQITSVESALSTAASQYSSLLGNVSALRANIANLTAIASLQAEDKIWTQRTISLASDSCNRTTFTVVPYSGYYEVDFVSSSSTSLTVSLTWTAYGVVYSSNAVPTVPGITDFVVLPTSLATLSFCNSNFIAPTSLVVSLVYHY